MNVRDILKKLFAVAEDDASTDGEIDNAMRAAASLMAAHQLTREDIITSEDDTSNIPITFARQSRYSMYQSQTPWESYLAKFITEFVPGTGYYRCSRQYKRNHAGMVTNQIATEIIFYGPEQDVQFCVEIWDEAVLVITSAARLRFGGALSRGSAAAYAEGFASSLYESNKRTQEVMKQDKQYALVVTQGGALTVKKGREWLKDVHNISLRSGRSSTSRMYTDRNAYSQGRADGVKYRPGVTKKAGLLT